MNRSSLLMSLALAGSITTVNVQACDVAAAFGIPTLLMHAGLSKRTVEAARAQAQATVYYYENHLGLFTMEDIRNAYWVVRATDKQIENKLWWENKFLAILTGLCTTAIYTSFKYPHYHRCCDPLFIYFPSSPSYPAPYYHR